MIKSAYFTGLDLTEAGALTNVNEQADKFLKANKGRIEENRTIVNISSNGAFCSATLQLNYKTDK